MRPARTTDQAALAELDALAWSAESGFPSVAGLKDGTFFTTANPPEAHLVAELDGRVVGSLSVHVESNPRRRHCAGIGMAVHDGFQGRGVGTALLLAALDLADNWLGLHRLA